MNTINHELIQIALEKCDGGSFERFAQAFLSAVLGTSFVPLGGARDGGADGMIEPGLFSDQTASHFVQATIQLDHIGKIRGTVARLREFGRDPRRLTYITSRQIPNLDRDEIALTSETGAEIRIRDRRYLLGHINSAAQTVQAFNSYLAPHLAFLKEFGGTTLLSAAPSLPARPLCVFLGQEVDRRRGKAGLLESVTDTLILWALEGTDPDKGVLMGRQEIREKIEGALPSARAFIRSNMDHRLEALASKGNPTGREVRWHRKEDRFCLPHETRELVATENKEDESLRIRVSDIFRNRASEEIAATGAQVSEDVVAQICHATLELTFQKQGLELAGFISNEVQGSELDVSIFENVREVIRGERLSPSQGAALERLALYVLRSTFYASTDVEREYLGKLSRTYFLLFTLRNEPRVVEYFQNMASTFVLYVGADLIIRALSEHYLQDDDKAVANLFMILRRAGSTLVLTERTLEEVVTHLRATDLEFVNNYSQFEPLINLDLARQVDRILIRSYLYARLDPGTTQRRPAGWRSHIGQFCTYTSLHYPACFRSLRDYLCEAFGFEFETSAEMERLVDPDEARALADVLAQLRRSKEKAQVLAYNDALHVLRVYARRQEQGEAARSNPFGYRTWWLTREAAILKATQQLVSKHHASYIIRPEFILNYISLAPTKASVVESFGKIFPSLLGVKLSNRMREDIVADYTRRIREVYSVNEARARALVGELVDRLKADQLKIYETNIATQ